MVTATKKSSKKKIAKKKSAGKKTVDPPSDPPPGNGSFGWEDQIPDEVKDEADIYMKHLRAKNRAAEKAREAKERTIEKMKEHGLSRIRIDEGEKWLIVEDKATLKTQKVNLEKDDTRQAVSP